MLNKIHNYFNQPNAKTDIVENRLLDFIEICRDKDEKLLLSNIINERQKSQKTLEKFKSAFTNQSVNTSRNKSKKKKRNKSKNSSSSSDDEDYDGKE